MKTKVAEILSKLTQNLPEMAFLLFSIRLTFLGAQIGDALALIAVTAYIGYVRFLQDKQRTYSDEITTKLQELEKTMAALKVDKVLQRGQSNEQKQSTPLRRF